MFSSDAGCGKHEGRDGGAIYRVSCNRVLRESEFEEKGSNGSRHDCGLVGQER